MHTDSVQGFLEKNERAFSRFVLLDHMDWLADGLLPALEQEWQWIVRRAAAGTRIIWRSGGLRTDFVDRLRVDVGGRQREVGELLTHHRHWACRVAPAVPRPHLRQFPYCRPGRMKTFCADLKTLYCVLLKPARGKDHAERMESFYAGQAAAYDSFRERLLPGRRELFAALPIPRDGVWVDLGGGTGANFEVLGRAP